MLLSLSSTRTALVAAAGATALIILIAHLIGTAEPSVPTHVLTWAYDGGYGGQTDGTTAYSTNAASTRHIQTWVSYAKGGNEKSYYDCYQGGACKDVFSYNPGLIFSTCGQHRKFISENSSEDYYLHDSSPPTFANRTSYQRMACGKQATVYFANNSNKAVGQWFARENLSGLKVNADAVMFQDDSGPSCVRFRHGASWIGPVELQGGPGCDANLTKALRTVADQQQWPDGTPVYVFANAFGLGHFKIANPSILGLIAPGSHIIGGIEENSLMYQTRFSPQNVFGQINTASLVYAENPAAFYVFLNTVDALPGSTNACVDAPQNAEDSCGQLQLRRDALAAFWLAYSEGHSVLWDNFNFSGGACCGGKHSLAVYPEESIYPRNPIQPLKTFHLNSPSTNGSGCGSSHGVGGVQSFVVACGTLNDGRTPAGVYVREFRECYNFGKLIGTGQCAVVMNTTNSAMSVRATWLTQSYTHSMTLNGGDVLAAGCDDSRCPPSALNPLGAPFAAGSTQVAAFDALFLFHS